MLSYYLKCKKNTESKSPVIKITKNEKITLLSKCAVCNNKKSKFTKDQESRQRIVEPIRNQNSLSKIPLLGDILF